jgi:hypothetical protein
MDVRVKNGVAMVVSGDALVALWQAPATAERWQWNFADLEQLARRSAAGTVVLDLILPSSSPPNAALRARMRQDFASLGPKLRKLVVVPLGDGLWLSIVRTIVRGTLLVAGQSRQQAVVATIDEGLDRIQQAASPDTPSRAELNAAVDALYGALGLRRTDAT